MKRYSGVIVTVFGVANFFFCGARWVVRIRDCPQLPPSNGEAIQTRSGHP